MRHGGSAGCAGESIFGQGGRVRWRPDGLLRPSCALLRKDANLREATKVEQAPGPRDRSRAPSGAAEIDTVFCAVAAVGDETVSRSRRHKKASHALGHGIREGLPRSPRDYRYVITAPIESVDCIHRIEHDAKSVHDSRRLCERSRGGIRARSLHDLCSTTSRDHCDNQRMNERPRRRALSKTRGRGRYY